MPDPTTLKALWEQELAAATDALDTTRAKLNDGLAREAAFRSYLARSLRAATARRTQIAALWRKAGNADTPADGEAIIQDVRDATISLQEDDARAAGAEAELVRAKAAARRLTSAVKRCAARVRAAEEGFEIAGDEHEVRQAMVAAAVTAPLDTVPAEAGAYLAGADYTALETAVQDAIPELLRDAAAARVDLERTRLGYAQELADFAVEELRTHWQDAGGAGDLADRALVGLQDAEQALDFWVSSGAQRLARATEVLGGLDLKISAAEAEAVAVVPVDAAAAVTAEVEALAAQKDVEMRRFQLIKSRSQCEVEPTGPRKAAVTMAENRLATAEGVSDAKVAVVAPLKRVVDAWQAELSTETWQAYLAFLEETESLKALEGTDPAAIATSVTDAEAEASSTLAAAWAADRGVEQWEEFIEEMRAVEHGADASHRQRLLHALQGDSFIPGLPPALPPVA